uniref:Non-structural protein 3 n=1 Tax=Rotavirus B (isolate RVB/Human/China/ADRV/1982) TaxID=10942 RepID=NSP3_ROTGA|nr:RecName: Full=Non-structural protein 3; Short=NSP3; AltName: Full=NCVP4; AltName: Full=Non-structural RNA-binding protein 34; Short=NS34 [Human rotavirus B]CAI30288.1 nonstructural protein 3 [Human rotavirus B]
MALDALASILETVLRNCGINEISRVTTKFEEALDDCGMKVDDWREAYYKERFPKRMTATTMASQIMNFEIENLQLRNKAWAEGADRKFRLLSSFEIGNKDGHTILVPKTRNAEILLANSTSDLKLSSFPSEAVAKLAEENEKMRKQIEHLREQQTSKSTATLCEALENMTERMKLIEREKETVRRMFLECDKTNQRLRKQIQICEEEATDRLVLVNSHHREEILIMKREIYRLQMENVTLKEQIDSIEQELDHSNRIVRGLANRAGLVVDEVDSGNETSDLSDDSDHDDHENSESDLEDMMDPGEDERIPRGGENPRRQARMLQMREEMERLHEDMEILNLNLDLDI